MQNHKTPSKSDEAFHKGALLLIIGFLLGAAISVSASLSAITTANNTVRRTVDKLAFKQVQLDLIITAKLENDRILDKILETLDYRLPRPITIEE